jgi:hypothetical protein
MARLLVPHEMPATVATTLVRAIDETFTPTQVGLASIARCLFTLSKEGSPYGYSTKG